MLITNLWPIIFLAVNLFSNTASVERTITQSTSVDTPPVLEEINKKVTRIDSELAHCKKEEKNLDNSSSEGGIIVAYYDGDTLRKIETIFYGETGKAVSAYYLDEQGLLFVKVNHFHYDQPMYLEGSQIKSVEESVYYFCERKLLLWRDLKGQFVASKSEAFKDEERYLLKAVEELQSLLLESEAASSSDDEQLYSRQALKAKQAFAQGIGQALKRRATGLVDMLRDPQATVEGYVALLGSIPELPSIIESYV